MMKGLEQIFSLRPRFVTAEGISNNMVRASNNVNNRARAVSPITAFVVKVSQLKALFAPLKQV